MGRMGANPRAYSTNASDYKILEEVGYGASATVYRAIYLPLNDMVAVKCLDLDRCNSNLDDIRREAQTMSLIDHPNVIKAYCSFVVDRNLWVVMPYMSEGSCLHLMKIAYPDGFEEAAICTILKETLKALEYLHQQGHIHRDVKAGNILLDSSGVVKLADFGVSACMFDTGERQRTRNTFVGTPCWMAPEVLQPGSGYNSKADIWSFGITALELAHGHAPFSKYPPMKVLLMTIQNAPPGLDYDRDKKFSKLFKEMVAMCLVKDQTKRPTAEKLLKHSFFKQAKPPEVSLTKLFADLPSLWHRVKALQLKDAAQLALKKMPSAEQEALSQSEYNRGVSAWNFDIEDLKAQASLIRDDDDLAEGKDDDEMIKTSTTSACDKDSNDCRSSLGQPGTSSELLPAESKGNSNGDEVPSTECLNIKGKIHQSDLVESACPGKVSLKKNGISNEMTPSTSEMELQAKGKYQTMKSRQTHSGPLMQNVVLSHSLSDKGRTSERGEGETLQVTDRAKSEVRRAPSFSGPLMLPNRASANSLSAPIKSSGGFRDSLDEKSKANLVQIKGRFSVTSENLDLVKDIPIGAVQRRSSQGSPLRKSASVGDWIFESRQMPNCQSSKELNCSSFPASVIMPHLQNLFQQTSLQQELIMSLLNSFQTAEVDATQNGKLPPLPRSLESNGIADLAASQRERILLLKISELQSRMANLTEELTAEKLKHMQLQQQLSTLSIQEENGGQREGDV
ncbi:serine/threonine-protein kinase BLUS1-like isoform X1 [Syzygium oleosum]|uniref:serine/threonine-protein kinase BLUS1-like isoform X1 n=1 Tax=Syzygium oleosum TaxID=219896 RepID=UPI0011D24EFD|nr:serine/threonine-protein kinase BLUS1-like isoform X1 [Syzygium oleosum]